MKTLLIILSLLHTISCSQPVIPKTSSSVGNDSTTIKINKKTFTNYVFDIAENTHLTSECTFNFECDCCFNQLLFTSNSTFIVISPCIEEISISHGKYEVSDNKLYLHYGGDWTSRGLISEEQDSIKIFATSSHSIKPRTEVYTSEVCKNTILYSEQTKTQIKMLRSKESLDSKLEYLKKIGLYN